MTKPEQGKTNAASPLVQGNHKFPHELDSATEEQILGRVRAQVLGEHLTTHRVVWPWALAGAMAACALLLWWGNTRQTTPAYQHTGLQKVAQSDAAKNNQTQLFQATPGQPGRIVVPKKWRLQTQGQTRVGVRTSSLRTQQIDLYRGFVDIHVQPKTMKRFAVHIKGFRVEVKGTIFSVERQKTWLQVEVWRGRVVLHTPQGTRRSVTGRQGCRVNVQQGPMRCYLLPPITHRAPHKRVKWLGHHHPKALLAYATNLASNPRISLTRRATLLREVTDALRKAQRWRAAIESYKLIAQLQVADSSQALVDAALLCRKTHSHNPRLCQSIFLQCLRQCQNTLWREQSLGLLAVSQFQQAKTSPHKARAIQTIYRYLRLHPKGNWQTNLRRLLVRHAITEGQSCKHARKLLANNDRGEAWFIKRCRP